VYVYVCVCVCVGVCVYVYVYVIRCNNDPLHVQWVGGRGQIKNERKGTTVYKFLTYPNPAYCS